MSKKIKTIGMVVAMDKEIKPFLASVGECVLSEKKGQFEVFGYKLKDKEIYLVKSGIGEIFASSATQLLISEYKVELILNFGVCGSLGSVSVLETVIVKGVVHYDFDLSAIDDVKVGEYPGYNSPIISAENEYLPLIKKVMGNVSEVVCASADKFVADKSVKNYLNSTFGAEVCDMECAGVLLTAKGANIPCIIIKAVSDGEGGAEEFNSLVHKASTAYVSAVNEIIKEF
ncbi:MAG: 5'-methylthioadenosine/S-adenosylhomocysteine nucleosidase [Clostridia bacterium]|nr:5'-methylthioadenosine/S-adenosylhomocysteine nucleosidase [Clostridia bacterium]